MSIRIPPALKWLVKKRSYISGQIAAAERAWKTQAMQLEKKHKLLHDAHAQHLQILQTDLETIDRALRMHEVPINPSNIPTVRFQANPTSSGYGQITRLIYRALASSDPVPMTTTKITAFVRANMNLNLSTEETKEFRWRVHHRLQGLCSQGKVLRLHPRSTHKEGAWRLPVLQIQALNDAAVTLEVTAKEARAS